MERKERLVQELRRIDGLILQGPVTLSSGIESDYKIDFERVEHVVLARDLLCQLLLEQIPPDTGCIVAEGGARWIAKMLVDRYRFFQATYVDNLAAGKITGHLMTDGERCCVLEDVVTTGGTMCRVGRLVETELNGTVSKYLAVIKRPEQDVTVPDRSGFSYILDSEDLL